MKGYDPDGGAQTEADHFRQLSDLRRARRHARDLA
jgi:hypothetical protein